MDFATFIILTNQPKNGVNISMSSFDKYWYDWIYTQSFLDNTFPYSHNKIEHIQERIFCKLFICCYHSSLRDKLYMLLYCKENRLFDYKEKEIYDTFQDIYKNYPLDYIEENIDKMGNREVNHLIKAYKSLNHNKRLDNTILQITIQIAEIEEQKKDTNKMIYDTGLLDEMGLGEIISDYALPDTGLYIDQYINAVNI